VKYLAAGTALMFKHCPILSFKLKLPFTRLNPANNNRVKSGNLFKDVSPIAGPAYNRNCSGLMVLSEEPEGSVALQEHRGSRFSTRPVII